RWQQTGYTYIDQPGFFISRDDFNGKPENFSATGKKNLAIPGFAQGLRGDGAYMGFPELLQTLGEARQAFPAALHGLVRQVALVIQRIALPDDFLEVFNALDLAMFITPDFQPETIGAKIDGG